MQIIWDFLETLWLIVDFSTQLSQALNEVFFGVMAVTLVSVFISWSMIQKRQARQVFVAVLKEGARRRIWIWFLILPIALTLGACATTKTVAPSAQLQPPAQAQPPETESKPTGKIELGHPYSVEVSFSPGKIRFAFPDGSTEVYYQNQCPPDMEKLFNYKQRLEGKTVHLVRGVIIPLDERSPFPVYILGADGLKVVFFPPEPMYEQ